jgi:electron transfer flavoprotein alpha subunit
MSNILIVAEHANGQLRKINGAVLGFAKQAAAITGGDVIALVLGAGDQPEAIAQQLAAFDINKVIWASDDALEPYLPAAHASCVAEVAQDVDARVVATVASFQGKDLLPRVAAKLDAAMISDVSAVTSEGGELLFKRPIWSGKLIEVLKASSDIICATIRATEFEPLIAGDAPTAEVEQAEPSPEDDGTEFVKFDQVVSERPELTDANVVVAGGRGLKARENFVMLEELADLFGGAVGASRAAVDSGMAPNDWQIGQTGKIVAPSLYFAVAISGAIQHLAGMKGSKCIVAINKDGDAPIFQVADYGLVADAFKVVPELNKLIAAAKKDA